jgi:hypothetical protein
MEDEVKAFRDKFHPFWWRRRLQYWLCWINEAGFRAHQSRLQWWVLAVLRSCTHVIICCWNRSDK